MSRAFKPNLQKIPGSAGVYLMYGGKDRVLYVGKAVNLRNRVGSYWNNLKNQSPKTLALLKKVRQLDFMVTDTEVEALILEDELIKRHRPPFNVLLRDDKTYQYIRVGLDEKFPTITTVRQGSIKNFKPKSGARYFGPYISGGAVKNTLKLIASLFPICNKVTELNSGRAPKAPCLNWHLGRCVGPCVGEVGANEYREVIDEVVRFLAGDTQHVIYYLTARMHQLSDVKKFEAAAKLRDRLKSLELIADRQKVSRPQQSADQDFLGHIIDGTKLAVSRTVVRSGKIIDQQVFILEAPMEVSEPELISKVLRSIYGTVFENLPKEVAVGVEPDERGVLERWLTEKRGGPVTITVPSRGVKKDLLELSRKNAAKHSGSLLNIDERLQIKKALTTIKSKLNLSKLPKRMEAYDISHLGGTYTVGSMVVFVDGEPDKKSYRRFRIKTVPGVDDYAALGEMIARRLGPVRRTDRRFASALPQVILIDGGKGQLSSVLAQVSAEDRGRIKFISIAKREEEIFVPNRAKPLDISKTSPAMYLLQRLRDEAHRFALSYQTMLRSRGMHD